MICYKDKTWCKLYHACKNADTCGRAFTDAERKKAIEWWGGEDFQLCVFSGIPDCMEWKSKSIEKRILDEGEE